MTKFNSFRKFLKEESNGTTSGDIATVASKLSADAVVQKRLMKGKKCKKHHRYDCPICQELEESKYN